MADFNSDTVAEQFAFGQHGACRRDMSRLGDAANVERRICRLHFSPYDPVPRRHAAMPQYACFEAYRVLSLTWSRRKAHDMRRAFITLRSGRLGWSQRPVDGKLRPEATRWTSFGTFGQRF
jgi:hypothetical protein